jgi:hypothetical protein
MRNIRGYALALSILIAVSAPAFATSSSGDPSGSFLGQLVDVLIVVFDEAKITVPPG